MLLMTHWILYLSNSLNVYIKYSSKVHYPIKILKYSCNYAKGKDLVIEIKEIYDFLSKWYLSKMGRDKHNISFRLYIFV